MSEVSHRYGTVSIFTYYVYVFLSFFVFFGHTSSCSHLYPKRQTGWAQFDPCGHVGGGLGAIRAVCRVCQAFYPFWGVGIDKANPRVSATSPGIGFSQLLLHKSRPYKSRPYKSQHRTSTCAGHVLMGLLLIYGSPPRRGESEPPPGGRLPTLRFSSCGQEHSFHYHQLHIAHRQSDVGFLDFVLAPLS